MPETITSYSTFSAGTKARASQVNTNFSNYRGTILPIDPNTATAISNTYNLGSTEYRWATAYLSTVNLTGLTSTTHFSMTKDASDASGGFNIMVGSTTVGYASTRGISSMKNMTTTAIATPTNFNTLSAKTIGVMTLKCRGGPVWLGLINSTNLVSYIELYVQATTASFSFKTAKVFWLYDSNTIATMRFDIGDSRTSIGATTGYLNICFPISATWAIHTDPPAGLNTYTCMMLVEGTGTGAANLYGARMMAMEM
jgi:hypothetical protein